MSLLDRLFTAGGLSVRFQPVFQAGLGAVPHGACYVECLVRGPEGTNLERADVLFSYVRRKHETIRVDRQCIATILQVATVLPRDLTLGLNVDATTLAFDPAFPDYLAATAETSGRSPARLIVEVVEHTPPLDVPAFHDSLSRLRALGVRIALDDVGLGHSNYRMILETRPEFLKVDRYLVTGVHSDPRREDILRSIAGLGRSFGAQVVAEGIEDMADLEAVRQIGIELVQGYGLLPPVTREALLEMWHVAETRTAVGGPSGNGATDSGGSGKVVLAPGAEAYKKECLTC